MCYKNLADDVLSRRSRSPGPRPSVSNTTTPAAIAIPTTTRTTSSIHSSGHTISRSHTQALVAVQAGEYQLTRLSRFCRTAERLTSHLQATLLVAGPVQRRIRRGRSARPDRTGRQVRGVGNRPAPGLDRQPESAARRRMDVSDERELLFQSLEARRCGLSKRQKY